MQCEDHGHHCFMCDAHAEGGRNGRCEICRNETNLRKAVCELCVVKQKDIVEWDTSFKRDLAGSESSQDSPFKRVICYECAKGEKGNWMVLVEGYGLRKVLRHHRC